MPLNALTIRALAARLGLLALSTLALSGCQSIQGTTTVSATLRVVDVSPNSGGLDFYLNKNILIYNVGSPSSTNYVPLNSGTYTVAATIANNSVNNAIATTSLGVATGKQYTVLAGNIPASLELTAYTDQNTPAPSGNVALRFLDQATSVGAIDIYLVPQGGKLITTNPFITGLTFDSNSGYINLPSGAYTVIIVPTGTIPIATTVATYSGPIKTYNAGVVDTLVIRDLTLTTSTPVDIMYLTDYTPPGS
jgi:hypothetical protein